MTPKEYRAHREKLGLTQAGLAGLLGLPRTAVTKREKGEQRITEEAAIAIRALKKQGKRSRSNDQILPPAGTTKHC